MVENENSSALIAYRKALEMAWLDGVITYDEAKILDTLRDYLHISEEVHWQLENEIKTTIPNPGIKEYRMALEQVWMDGLLTNEEKKMLKELQNKYNISDKVHVELEKKVKSELGITIQESEIYFPEKFILENENYLLEQDPGNEDSELFWINKGKKQWYISNQNLENGLKAIEYFDKAIDKNSKSFVAWIYKGCIYKKLNLPDKAIQCYDRAIELKNDFIASWYNKGMLLAQVSLNQIEEAIKCFDEVLKINPNHPLAIRDREIFDKLSQICSKQQQSKDT